MAVQTLLILLITILGYSEWITGTSYLQRPIILGTLVGIALGDPTNGLVMGATMELAMVGAVSVGGFTPPDLVSGTVLGVSLAIVSGGGAKAALTIGIPVATIVLAFQTAVGAPLELLVVHQCDRWVEKNEMRKFDLGMILTGYLFKSPGIVFVPLAFYFGSDWVTHVLSIIPDFVQTGMGVATGMLPALGCAMLVRMIANKKNVPFFFLGFFLVAFFSLTTTQIAIIAGIGVAIAYFWGSDKQTDSTPAVSAAAEDGDGFDEF